VARIFFALEVPDNLRRQITQLQQEVPVNTGDIKWVEKNNLHITLYFAGEVEEAKLQILLERAENVAAQLQPFKIGIRGMGAFPNVWRPQVLWLGIDEGKAEITTLAKMLAVTKGKKQKSFVPHLTIGRIRSGRKVNLKRFLQQQEDYALASYLATKFCCFQSELTPQGPIYTKIREFFFS